MENKHTFKFFGYYLAPFVLNCVSVFTIWNVDAMSVFCVALVVTFLCNTLWVWFTPNRHAISAAFLVVLSWVYAWMIRVLSFPTRIGWFETVAIMYFVVIGAFCAFISALLAGSKRLRFNSDGRYDSCKMTVEVKWIKSIVCILVIPLFAAVGFGIHLEKCRERPYTAAAGFAILANTSAKVGVPLGTDGHTTYYTLRDMPADVFVYAEKTNLFGFSKEVMVSPNAEFSWKDFPVKKLQVTYDKKTIVIRDEEVLEELIAYVLDENHIHLVKKGEETIPVEGVDIADAHILFDISCDLTWKIEMERTPHGTVWVHMPYETGVYDVTHILGEYLL